MVLKPSFTLVVWFFVEMSSSETWKREKNIRKKTAEVNTYILTGCRYFFLRPSIYSRDKNPGLNKRSFKVTKKLPSKCARKFPLAQHFPGRKHGSTVPGLSRHNSNNQFLFAKDYDSPLIFLKNKQETLNSISFSKSLGYFWTEIPSDEQTTIPVCHFIFLRSKFPVLL